MSIIWKLIKFGIPLSFVHCTIYQMDVWRKGDDGLIKEQKRVWKDFFAILDKNYQTVATKLKISSHNKQEARANQDKRIVAIDFKKCWNHKVMSTFSQVDKAVSKPGLIVCKVMRWYKSKTEASKQTQN